MEKKKYNFENQIINDWIFYESSEIKKSYNFVNYLKGESIFKCFFDFDYCNNCRSFIALLSPLSTLLSIVVGIVFIGLYICVLAYIDLCCGCGLVQCFIEECKEILCECKIFRLQSENFGIVLKKICLYFISIFSFIFYF